MIFADTENLVGIRVEKKIGKPKIEFIRFSSGEEIFSLPDREKNIFFPDPFSLTLRFFDYPFGGRKAKDAAEIEISSEEFSENEKYVLWVPRKKGTTIALIYDVEEARKLFEKGATSIYFKPSCLLAMREKYGDRIFVEVGERTVSVAYSDGETTRLGFFSYSDRDDIKVELGLFLSQVKDKDKIGFVICGPRHDIFPFECEVASPSDILQDLEEKDPAFTALVCATIRGKFPELKLGGKKDINLAVWLSKSLPISVISTVYLVLLNIPVFLDVQIEKQKQKEIIREMQIIFQKTFPGKKVVDPYEQMKIEYAKMRKNGTGGILPVFFVFSKSISDLVVRIEDFRISENELSAQLKISELSYVEGIRTRLSEIMQDVKVTSTVRSRDGKFFIMRITGKLKRNLKLKELI